mgnify:CR=1 FL=1
MERRQKLIELIKKVTMNEAAFEQPIHDVARHALGELKSVVVAEGTTIANGEGWHRSRSPFMLFTVLEAVRNRC